MIRRSAICAAFVLTIALTWSPRVDAQIIVQPNPSDAIVVNATNAFAQAMVMPQNEIPRSLLAEAQAVAIVPSMVRGAFVVGVQHGRGVLVIRDAQGAWQPPRFIQITGGSFGYQIGVQATDLVLVFRTQQSVANLLRGTMKIGVDASASAGPVGRQTSAATDLQLQAEILSYSRARGAFVGVSIDGSVISLDPNAEAIYYQPPGAMPASTMQLLQVLTAYSAVVPAAGIPVQAAATGGWVAAGQNSGDTESARQQLDRASRQLAANLDENWKRYLALPPEVYTPNAAPSQQALQQATSRYEEVSRRPEYAALQARPEFQDALRSLRRLSEVRTASNSTLQLPPPPR
ncbi:MAG: lipid-binding SYLF domain-containing protein [Planctomycetes bacterium]|nr:lipid-binding SYLF domain-containing protein [Planctomycetota bacterium]